MSFRTGATVALIGAGSLLGGLPFHVLETGQLDPVDWAWPVLIGAGLALALLDRVAVVIALFALLVPPLVLCCVGAAGRDPWRIWVDRAPAELPVAGTRPMLGILSGPPLHHVVQKGIATSFATKPLWAVLSRRFTLRPIDALDDRSLSGLQKLLVIQPRALAPGELVALDKWVRMGGEAVLLVDPDLRWADKRPLGDPLRPPPISLLGPLLRHWGVDLAPVNSRNPAVRRVIEDGLMVQLAGSSQFFPRGKTCVRALGDGLVVRCILGRGRAILIADADFAHDALWTVDPARPENMRSWTSDAVPLLIHWLNEDTENPAKNRVWLAHADGLPAAVRAGLLTVIAFALAAALSGRFVGRRNEKRSLFPPG